MTITQVIEYCDRVKPNAFDEAQKVAWINDVEGFVQTNIHILEPEDMIMYEWPEDQNTQLLVQEPHSKIYRAYVSAMIDYENGEFNKYQNSMELYNEFLGEYINWYAGRYRPADPYWRAKNDHTER